MSRHTPGPWVPDYTQGDVRSPVGDVAVTLYGGMRAIGVGGNEATLAPITRSEAEANARLIAAAPELLAAGRKAFGVLAGEDMNKQSLIEALSMLRAAIAKATEA